MFVNMKALAPDLAALVGLWCATVLYGTMLEVVFFYPFSLT